VALCRAGFKYTSATTGRAFSALQNLDVLAGNRTTSSPDVKILDDGRVIVAYESLRYNGRVGPYAQIGGSIGTFGGAFGPPLAFTAEVDHTDSENQGGYFGNEPTIVEGPGSQPYIAVIGDSTNTIAALDHSGKLGQAQPLTLSAFPDSVDAKLGIAPGGVGFSIYSKEQGDTARTSRVTLWTSSFSVPSP
jgi:hypothetical protein